MIWKTAWKNVWRNKVRSLVVIISVTIGILGGIFAVAVMNGAIVQRIDAALNQEVGHIHINDPSFRDNYDMHLYLPHMDQVLKTVKETPGVQAVAPRTIINGMANTASKSAGVQILGIDPEAERSVFRLYETTIPGTGDFFETPSRQKIAYIGQDLAKELNIIRYWIEPGTMEKLRAQQVPETTLEKLSQFMDTRFKSEKSFTRQVNGVLTMKEQKEYGRVIKQAAWSFRERSRMTLTFLDKNGMQTGAVFRIAGIYDIKNNMYEMGQVFVRSEDLEELTGLTRKDCHQLIIRVDDLESAGAISTLLAGELPELEVMSWKEIQPDLAMMTGMVQQFYTIFMIIILAALAFGIVNTMLMVVLERTKELGMLTAIGMNKKRVFNMIMMESVFLSMVGGLAGMGVSRLLILLTAKNGIDLHTYEEGFEAIGYSAHIYPSITPGFFMVVTILIIITGILSSIYPALKALKLDPAEALRTE